VKKIIVRVRPASKTDKVEKQDETHYHVWLKAPPKDGKANMALIAVLADFWKLPKSRVVLLKGQGTKTKMVGVLI